MSRSADEGGMTLIEVVVAAFALALVIGAGALLFSAGNSGALQGQRQSQLIEIADQQIEMIRQQVKTSGFASLAMSQAPAAGTGTTLPGAPTTHTDPNDFVSAASACGSSNEGYLIESNWDDTSSGVLGSVGPFNGCATGAEPLVVAAGGIVSRSQSVTVGTSTYTVDSYVTDTNVGCASLVLGSCLVSGSSSLTPLGDARRVIVAVSLLNGGTNNTGTGARYNIGQSSPVYVSTVFTNPVPSNQSNAAIGLTLGTTIG